MDIFDNFIIRAVMAGLGLALAAAPLGCFVVWRRMAYFGDATAHAAILGVAISLAFSMSVFIGVLGVAVSMALIITLFYGRGYGVDTLLGVLSHGALAAGLVAVSFLSNIRIDLMAYLFGDILAVTRMDLWIIWGGAGAVLALMIWRWSSLLTATLSPDLAHAAGISPRREQLILTLAIAIVVAVAIKVVGALLIGAMLIIPAAAARPVSGTPERMVLITAMVGALSVLCGLWGAFWLDTPAGPSIICVAVILFMFTNLFRRVAS